MKVPYRKRFWNFLTNHESNTKYLCRTLCMYSSVKQRCAPDTAFAFMKENFTAVFYVSWGKPRGEQLCSESILYCRVLSYPLCLRLWADGVPPPHPVSPVQFISRAPAHLCTSSCRSRTVVDRWTPGGEAR